MSQLPSPQAEGFLLLTLANAKLSAPFLNPPVQTGLLSLQCVTIPLSQSDGGATNPLGNNRAESDVWLVLLMNNTEFPLSASDTIQHSRINRTFSFRAPEGIFLISFPPPSNPSEIEDLETFEVLLAQYGALRETDPEKGGGYEGDIKGRLVLVDEDDGEIVGTLGEEFKIREDPNVARNEKSPVIIEMPEEGQHEINVHSIEPDEQDFILKSAQFISRGIVGAADMIGKGMGMASTYYVNNSKPNPEPMVFSEAARTNMRRIHAISGTAVKVTTKTTGLIHGLIDRAADKLAGSPSAAARDRAAASTPGYSSRGAPALPPRGAEKGGLDQSRSGTPSMSGQQQPPAPPKRLLNRLLMSTDLILTALEGSAQQLIVHTTDNLSTGLGHKYGADMGAAVRTMGDSARNVGVVYIDVRGVGRRALIKRVGKRVIKGRMGKQEVVFGGDEAQGNIYNVVGGPSGSAPSSRAATMSKSKFD